MKKKGKFNGATPTQERLLQLLNYDQTTGQFTRRITVSGNAKSGSICGWQHKTGYIYVGVDGRSYKAHRLAWVIMAGHWPTSDIDHKDNNKANNAWSNLRAATAKQNCANSKIRKDNKSGIKGARLVNGRWQVRIGSSGRIHVGTYDSADEARTAYERAAKKEYGQFARVV